MGLREGVIGSSLIVEGLGVGIIAARQGEVRLSAAVRRAAIVRRIGEIGTGREGKIRGGQW
jgi:hypothetical protein